MRGELYIKAVACAALLGIVGMGCKSNDNAGLTSIPSFAGSGNNPGGGNPNTGPGNGNDTGGCPVVTRTTWPQHHRHERGRYG